MIIETVIGNLTLEDLQSQGAEECFASSVRLAAKEFYEVIRKLPDMLKNPALMLSRNWLGDNIAKQFVKAIEINDVLALSAFQGSDWAIGVDNDTLGLAYQAMSEQTRRPRAAFTRARHMADRGMCDELTGVVQRGWAGRLAGRTMSMGSYRSFTGCKCPDPMHCQCMVKHNG